MNVNRLIEAIIQLKYESDSTGKLTDQLPDTNKILDSINLFEIRKISANFIQVEQACEVNSDHFLIPLSFSDIIIIKENISRLTNRVIDWQSLRVDHDYTIDLSVLLRTADHLHAEVKLLVANTVSSTEYHSSHYPVDKGK